MPKTELGLEGLDSKDVTGSRELPDIFVNYQRNTIYPIAYRLTVCSTNFVH